MLTIYDGRSHFWQWDINQKLKVDAGHACEVHFRDPNGSTALVVDTYTLDGQTVADVPNAVLHESESVLAWVYICEGDECTKYEARFAVWPRQKPADYVYTETEIKRFSDLDERMKALEGAGIVLPPVTEKDDGKVMTVVGGAWVARDLPKYDGTYEVTPLADESTTLLTAQKFMDSNVVVNKVPYYETSNTDGGETVYIATEVDIYGD